MSRNSYSVFFNGVLHSHHASKGAALDAAYQHVNNAQHVHATHAARGSDHCRDQAERLSKLMGLLASTIPNARRTRSTGRFVLNVSEMAQSVSVRRDAY